MNMQTLVLKTSDPSAILTAIQVLQLGGLIAFPTDTVYGLACDPFSQQAIEGLYVAKTRSAAKAIAVLIGSLEQLDSLTPGLISPAQQLAQHFWPGGLTLVVPRLQNLPENLSPYPTLGVRMPNHPFTLQLLRQAGPLATTSANSSNAANTVTARSVLDQLDGRIHLLLDGGDCPGGIPSTVVDCTQFPPIILRSGAITEQEIQAVLQQ